MNSNQSKSFLEQEKLGAFLKTKAFFPPYISCIQATENFIKIFINRYRPSLEKGSDQLIVYRGIDS